MSSKLGDRFGSKLALGLLMLGASSKLDLTAEQRMKLEALKETLVDINKAHQAERVKHLDEIKRQIHPVPSHFSFLGGRSRTASIPLKLDR